jgi:arylsulfatase A-like enzyme
MNVRAWLVLGGLAWLNAAWPASVQSAEARLPSIVYILADDLGYGDVRCLNPAGKIATPHLDRLAAQGMLFTDAHSGSSVCTPTRYGILTGRYAWRSRLKRNVLLGYAPRLIEPGRLTVPALLGKHGYYTACVGKWHLGMDWPLKDGGTARGDGDAWKVDYTKPIRNGPLAVGFDRYFGISASLDMAPFAFIDNDRTRGVPNVERTVVRKGPGTRDFEASDVLPTLTREAVGIIHARAAEVKKGKPLFLYLALNSPHAPIVPAAGWKGRSKLNAYADFVMQTDDAVGQVLAALEKTGLAEHTLVIFTSDNGCSPVAGIAELVKKGHHPSYHFRGHKADIFEGGHRIPLLVRWPGKVKPASRSDELTCLTDLMRTCADIIGIKLSDEAGEDSVSMLPALLGKATGPLREAAVHHSFNGSFAIRQGKWKLCLCPDSGGWSAPRPGKHKKGLPDVQLYDLEKDPGEKTNLHDRHPEVVARLTRLLQKYADDGRSTAGKPQKNTTPVQLRP